MFAISYSYLLRTNKIGAIDQQDMGLNPDLSLDFCFNSEYWLSGLVDPTIRKLSRDVMMSSLEKHV